MEDDDYIEFDPHKSREDVELDLMREKQRMLEQLARYKTSYEEHGIKGINPKKYYFDEIMQNEIINKIANPDILNKYYSEKDHNLYEEKAALARRARQQQKEREEKLQKEREARPRLFIHIPKNGGMTIRRSSGLKSLITTCMPNKHKSSEYTKELEKTMAKLGDHHGHEHARWRDLSEEAHDKYLCFAIVRNPWERVVSRYLFAKKVIEVEKKVPESYANVSSFEAFLEERHKWGHKPFMWHRAVRGWYNQVDYVTEEHSEQWYEDDCAERALKCSILRLEHIDEDIRNYFKLPSDFSLQPRNVTAMTDQSYLDFYTPETTDMVERWYKRDIQMFGFDFDTSATRNYFGA